MNGNNLKHAIQMYDFYLNDLHLYLDSHPYDRNALILFNKYTDLRRVASDAYVEKYGPLTVGQSNTNDRFNWTDGPWPWERSAN